MFTDVDEDTTLARLVCQALHGRRLNAKWCDGSCIVHIGSKTFIFKEGLPPFDHENNLALMRDKWRFFRTFQNHVPMPETIVLPHGTLTISTVVTNHIKSGNFRWPLVVKPNDGSLAQNVFIVHNESELEHAIRQQNSSSQQSRILIQQYVGDHEIRAVCLNGRCELAYTKDRLDPSSGRPLSAFEYKPYTLVTHDALLEKVNRIAHILYERFGIIYAGCDIRVTSTGDIFLIEANCGPLGIGNFRKMSGENAKAVDGLINTIIDHTFKVAHTVSPQPCPQLVPAS